MAASRGNIFLFALQKQSQRPTAFQGVYRPQREESGSGSGMNRIETDQESHIVATARGGVPGDRQTESARRRDAFSLI